MGGSPDGGGAAKQEAWTTHVLRVYHSSASREGKDK